MEIISGSCRSLLLRFFVETSLSLLLYMQYNGTLGKTKDRLTTF